MRKLFLVLAVTTLSGCAGLMKNDAYRLDRTNSGLFKANCEHPGSEGDLVKVDGVPVYFEPVRKFTMIGPPLIPLIPVNFGFGKGEVKLMFAPGWSAEPTKWKIRLNASGEWIVGTSGESRLGSFISFKVPILPDVIELQYADDSSQLSSARFSRHGDWEYRPIIGWEGEQLRGWLPGCGQ